MTRAVDLVIVGSAAAGIAAGVAAAESGERVLVVLRPIDRRAIGRVRRTMRAAGAGARHRMRVMTATELVCVDGIGGVEAVVVRRTGSGRLVAFNARAIVMATASVETA